MKRSEESPAPSHRRRLTNDAIVRETLALIDEQGVAAASMRPLARRLGVQVMTLYRYVANREELFDAVVEHIVDELSEDVDMAIGVQDGDWRGYLSDLAWGVRRYALAHPHAFPLVATRPPTAPWVNPPLRSLRWIEAMLAVLGEAGFTDDEALLTYRTFNSFLLGYLLLETSAMVIADPKPGDGSFQAGTEEGSKDPVDPDDPIPGSISPTRDSDVRAEIAEVNDPVELVDVDPAQFPEIHRLREGLTEDRFEQEFAAGLDVLLTRIETQRAGG